MGRRCENNRIEVTEDNVADVVSMMTGIPVNRIAQTESKLAYYRNWSKVKLLDKRSCFKIARSIQRNRAEKIQTDQLVPLFS
jgi:ATP-dependent Clp protease ATP-binding subunit ClpC